MPEGTLAEPATTRSTDHYAVTVLLVDDQKVIGDIVGRILRDLPNLYFFHCTDARAAVALAESVNPTVILQDLVLPGASGLALLRQYRANPLTRDVPVVILSIKDEPALKSAAFRAGASDYIVKLPDAIELIARVRHHSRAYLNQIQRDEAYRALRDSQKRLFEMTLELQRLNSVDGLTELNNRRRFDEYLAVEWKRAARERKPLSVLMIDVDEFKRYNDSRGHLAGDEALKRIAAAIRRSCERPADLPARYGGEEFIVVLPNTALAGAETVAEKVRRNVEQLRIPHPGASAADHVTVSIGAAAAIPERETVAAALIQAADTALYQAKGSGRNRVVGAR